MNTTIAFHNQSSQLWLELNLVAFVFYFLIHFVFLLQLFIVNRKFSIKFKLKIVSFSFLVNFILNDFWLIFLSQILASYWITLLRLPQYVGSVGLTSFIVLLNNIKAYWVK